MKFLLDWTDAHDPTWCDDMTNKLLLSKYYQKYLLQVTALS